MKSGDRWSVVERVMRWLYGEAGSGLVGDVIERHRRSRRERGRMRAFAWLCRELVGATDRGVRGRFGGGAVWRAVRLDDMWRDARVALRTWSRARGFTAVAVITLAIGVGASATLFSVANSVLWRPLPYPSAERIVRLGAIRNVALAGGRTAGFGAALTALPPRIIGEWQSSLSSFDAIAGMIRLDLDLTGEGEARRVIGVAASPELKGVLGMPMVVGRWFDPADDVAGGERFVVISHALWRDALGGADDVVGRRVMMAGQPRTVLGVLAADFRGPEALGMSNVDAWIPIHQSGRDLDEVNNYFVNVAATLRPGVSFTAANEELELVTRRLTSAYPASSPASSMQAGMVTLMTLTVGSAGRTILLLFGASGLLLLIAGVNLAHLLLARGAGRGREIAVRSALGAGRVRIGFQLATEGLLLSLAGGLAGALLAVAGVALFRYASPSSLPRAAEVVVDGRVLVFALGVAAFIGLVFGAAPVAARRVSAGDALREGVRAGSGPGSGRLRSRLVATETALAVVLLCGAALLANSFVRLMRVDPGFAPDGAVEMVVIARSQYDSRDARVAFFADIRERLAALPGVRAVGMTNGEAFGGASAAGSYRIEGRQEPESEYVRWQLIDAGLPAALGARIVSGRNITSVEVAAGEPVMIVNETFERAFFANASAVGARMKVIGTDESDAWLTIVGVIGDMRPGNLARAALPETYVPYTIPDFIFPSMSFVVRTNGVDEAAIGPALRGVLRDVDPDQPVLSVATLHDRIAVSLVEPRFYMLLIGTFAGAAILLSAIGLYGTLACTLAVRRRELGVRVVLGATRQSLVALVLRIGLVPLLAGIGIGLAASVWLSRLLEDFVFGIGVTDGPTYLAVAAMAVTCGLLACVVPATRAARSDPREALQEG